MPNGTVAMKFPPMYVVILHSPNGRKRVGPILDRQSKDIYLRRYRSLSEADGCSASAHRVSLSLARS